MEFFDSAGTRYQLAESAEAPAPAKKTLVWPWVVGGIALAGGLVWMASSTSRKANPVSQEIEALILEARDPSTEWRRLWALFNHPEIEVRRALLDNPNLCPTNAKGLLNTDLLKALVPQFPEEVAAHPAFVLHALIEPNEEMIWVVRNMAEKTKDPDLLRKLYDIYQDVLDVAMCIAGNTSTSVSLLVALSDAKLETRPLVRTMVLANKTSPMYVLDHLATQDPDFIIREEAGNLLKKREKEGILPCPPRKKIGSRLLKILHRCFTNWRMSLTRHKATVRCRKSCAGRSC